MPQGDKKKKAAKKETSSANNAIPNVWSAIASALTPGMVMPWNTEPPRTTEVYHKDRVPSPEPTTNKLPNALYEALSMVAQTTPLLGGVGAVTRIPSPEPATNKLSNALYEALGMVSQATPLLGGVGAVTRIPSQVRELMAQNSPQYTLAQELEPERTTEVYHKDRVPNMQKRQPFPLPVTYVIKQQRPGLSRESK